MPTTCRHIQFLTELLLVHATCLWNFLSTDPKMQHFKIVRATVITNIGCGAASEDKCSCEQVDSVTI